VVAETKFFMTDRPDVSSEELKNALSRRLKKIDSANANFVSEPRPDPYTAEQASDDNKRSPEKKGESAYRSGWSVAPPIMRANIYAAAPSVRPTPIKSEIKSQKVCSPFIKYSNPFSPALMKSQRDKSTSCLKR
jgi:hypothetical protein